MAARTEPDGAAEIFGKEDTPVFSVLDVMRYQKPPVLPKDIRDVIIEFDPPFLYDVFLVAGETVLHGFLHPQNYGRLHRGFVGVGSRVAIVSARGDVIEEIDVLDVRTEEAEEMGRIKREELKELPKPIYNRDGFYMPFLNDEDYIRWDPSWRASLEEEDGHETEDIDLRSLGPPGDQTLEKTSRSRERPYARAKDNRIRGRVILKSKLFFYLNRLLRFPCLFFFILEAPSGLVKVLVWDKAVKRYFCVEEGDDVFIKGFKVRKKRADMVVAERTNTDKDTRYSSIPEIAVNLSSPVGVILRSSVDIGHRDRGEADEEFFTVQGKVEYLSSLMRWRSDYSERIKEFFYLRVGGVPIKLYNNASREFYQLGPEVQVEIRHLRQVFFGEFFFYISSVYTSIFFGGSPEGNHDHQILCGKGSGKAIEGSIGYIPCTFRTLSEYEQASQRGLGALHLGGQEADCNGMEGVYIRKEFSYYSSLSGIEVLVKGRNSLFVDELKRFLFCGRVSGVKHGAESTYDGEEIDVTYSQIINEDSVSKVQDSVALRVEAGDGEGGGETEVYLFRNYLSSAGSLRESVEDFFKRDSGEEGLYKFASSFIGKRYYFVVDALRVSEEVVVHIGVSLLR
jgi:Domain of unknown function (DUF5088)